MVYTLEHRRWGTVSIASSVSLVHAFTIKDPRVYNEPLNYHSDVFILTAEFPGLSPRSPCFETIAFTVSVLHCPLSALFFLFQHTFLKSCRAAQGKTNTRIAPQRRHFVFLQYSLNSTKNTAQERKVTGK